MVNQILFIYIKSNVLWFDCVPMKKWKAFLVQLLNIAGTGPIFGALMGAVFGTVVFLRIVFGSLLTALPATFMTAVSITNILMAKEGFRQEQAVSYTVGATAAALLLIVYPVGLIRKNRSV